MKKLLKILLIIFTIFVLTSGGGLFYLSRGLEDVANLNIYPVALSEISDGEYIGKYHGGRWTNEIKVTVKNHQIVQIDVLKDVLFSRPEVTSKLINQVVKQQKLDVDSISGATVTCKAYLKSIENAFVK